MFLQLTQHVTLLQREMSFPFPVEFVSWPKLKERNMAV